MKTRSNPHDLDGRSVDKLPTPPILWQLLPDGNKGNWAESVLPSRMAHAVSFAES